MTGVSDAGLHGLKRRQGDKRRLPGGFFHPLHFFFLDDEGNDPRAQQTVAFFHGGVVMTGGDHDLVQVVYRVQTAYVHRKKPVAVGDQLDFPFFYRGGMHIFILADLAEDLGGFVLVEHVRVLFPYVQMIFSQGQKNRDVLFLYDVAFAKGRVFYYVFDDSRDVMAQHMAHSVGCMNAFHGYSPYTITCFFFHHIVSGDDSQQFSWLQKTVNGVTI